MTTLIRTIAVSGTLFLVPALAHPQYAAGGSPGPATGVAAEAATPSTPPPSGLPPAPPAGAQASRSAPPGQWVYTQQYGWIWMPYADAYTYVPLSGYGAPYVFAYYPIFGWTWLAAPWVWGFGPWPFFGVVGPARFAWFVHGWWRFPARWHYLPTTRVFYGMRSAPFNRFGTLPGRVGRGPYMSGTGFRGGAPFMGGGRGNRFAPRAGMMGRGFSGR